MTAPGNAHRDAVIQFDILRIVAAAAIVLLHVSAGVIVHPDKATLPQWWAANLGEVVSRWGVPMFVMISGALLLDDRRPFIASQFYTRRAARMLWPLIFWTAVYLAYRRVAWQTGRATLIIDTLKGEPFYHLWFLYMILGLYAATPLLRVIAANSNRATLTIAAALIFFVASVDRTASATLSGFDDQHNIHTLAVLWLPFTGYFLTGYILTKWPFRIGIAPTMICIGISCVALSLLAAYVRPHFGCCGPYPYDPFNPIIIYISVLLFACFSSIPVSCSPRMRARTAYLASLTLGVYLVHPFWIEVLSHFGITGLRHSAIAAVPLTALAVFLLSAITTAAIRATPVLRRVV